ncbi:hypothetical protein GCM10023185_41400 [Hymenobacter saemangeumensis]|uniref:Uncharacterized protein n=1 Tax=Hymenobacter saemangeumensis TaxID=1084522 RepID=A0ABP8IRB4_9BACT
MKPFLVKKLRIKEWDEAVSGLWLAENEEWVLLRRLYDYRPDGYVLVAKSYIESDTKSRSEAQTARVLKLKGIDNAVPEGFMFGNVVQMFQCIQQQYQLFQFQDEEDSSFCGQLRDYDETGFRINSLSPRAELDLDYDLWFRFNELVTIDFENDYLASLALLWQDKARRKWKINQRIQSN